MRKIVYACDVGSTKPKRCKFGWVRMDLGSKNSMPEGSKSIDGLILRLEKDLLEGTSIALGFEAPLYMPVPIQSESLSKGRADEGNRSMFAPIGGYVTTLGCHQSAFILSRISNFKKSHKLTLDPTVWRECTKPTILIWEAFVSGPAHSKNGDDVHDAATAADYFRAHQNEFKVITADPSPPLSLVGAVALWSGWRNDIAVLKEKCLVLRPDVPYGGGYTNLDNPA